MPKTIVEDNIDILVAGAGLGGTGAAFEARYWGKDKKIVIAKNYKGYGYIGDYYVFASKRSEFEYMAIT